MSGAELKQLLLSNGIVLADVARGLRITSQDLNSKLGAKSLKADFIERVEEVINKTVDDLEKADQKRPTGADIRRNKALGTNRTDDDDGLVAVPIGAQAGGARYYDDPLYANHLEVYKLPGMPYRGAKYRLFQVDGDSMEFMNERGRPDGLVDRMWIVTQKVEPQETANNEGEILRKFKIDNYYIYVIVEQRRIRVKRLYQFPNNDSGFVVISDNSDWPQEWLPAEEVQELWLFKRKLDWDASPPKMFDITIEPPKR